MKYQSEYYEDVARIIEEMWLFPNNREIISSLADNFADLFAADNPIRCRVVGGHDTPCGIACLSSGFDREQFLAACGLES